MQTQNRQKKVKERTRRVKNKLTQNVFYPQPDSRRRNEEKFKSLMKTSTGHHAPVQTRSYKTLSHECNSNPRAKVPAHMTGMDRLSCDKSATQDPPLYHVTCNSNINSTTHWNINPILHFLRLSKQCRVNQVNVPKEGDFRRVRKIAKNNYQLRHGCSSVCPHGTTRLPLEGFSWNLISENVSKIGPQNSSFIEIGQE